MFRILCYPYFFHVLYALVTFAIEPMLHIRRNKALANQASGLNNLIALIGGLVALKFCLLEDHFDDTQQWEL